MHKFLNNNGLGLLEVLISGALLGGLILAALALGGDRQKSANAIEFAGKKEQIRLALVEQILSDRSSCACMFGKQIFNTIGVARLDAISPSNLGRYHIPPASDCSSASIPSPIVTPDGLDHVKVQSISVQDIKLINGKHYGNFVLVLSSMKEVMGSKVKGIRVPVFIETLDAGGGNVSFQGCSTNPNSVPLMVPEEHGCGGGFCNIPGTYRFCGMSYVGFGGNGGGGGDYCKVQHAGGGNWLISKNGSAHQCNAMCFK